MLLSGKTAIISGAASKRGIGLATARRFVAEGARVAIFDIDGAAAVAAAQELGARSRRHRNATSPITNPALMRRKPRSRRSARSTF